MRKIIVESLQNVSKNMKGLKFLKGNLFTDPEVE